MSNNREFNDNEKVVKLVKEYTERLKKLIEVYHEAKEANVKASIMMIGIVLFISTIAYGVINYQLDLSKSKEYIPLVFFTLMLIYAVTYIITLAKKTRSQRDIIDEASLIRRQLIKLIGIASQSREHSRHYQSELNLLEIDLKLTEAEDMVDRADRTFRINKKLIFNDFKVKK